jgi:hypothetical protein
MRLTVPFEALLIEVDYAPGMPGKHYGPPENCYEAEPPYLVIIGWKFEKDAQDFEDCTGIDPSRVDEWLSQSGTSDKLLDEAVKLAETTFEEDFDFDPYYEDDGL